MTDTHAFGFGHKIASWILPASQRESILGDLEEDARQRGDLTNMRWWLAETCSIAYAYYLDSFRWPASRTAIVACLLVCPPAALLLIGSAHIALGGVVPDNIPTLALLTPAIHASWLATGAIAGFIGRYLRVPLLLAAIVVTTLVVAGARLPMVEISTVTMLTTGTVAMIGIWLGSVLDTRRARLSG